MGLDPLEFILLVEEEFGIEIPEEDAQQIVTVGEMVEYLLLRVPQARLRSMLSPGWCKTQQAFYLMRRLGLGGLKPALGRTARPGDSTASRLSPWRWAQLRGTVNRWSGTRLLPDAKRGLLRWPVAVPETVPTLGDAARMIASSPVPLPRCRAPLGESSPSELPLRFLVFRYLRDVLCAELDIPLEEITWDSRFVTDLSYR